MKRFSEWLNERNEMSDEEKEFIGQKLGSKHVGYGSEMAKNQKDWDAAAEDDAIKYGKGGRDEYHPNLKLYYGLTFDHKEGKPTVRLDSYKSKYGKYISFPHQDGGVLPLPKVPADTIIKIYNKDAFLEKAAKYLETNSSSTIQKVYDAVKNSTGGSVTVKLPLGALQSKKSIVPVHVEV